MVHSPENRSTGISQAWRKLVSQQPEKAKDKFAGTCCIGHNFGWIQPGLLFQKTFQHKDRVPQRPRYNDAMKAGILIGHKVVPGDPSVITKVFAVRSGIDCSDWRNKAHSICRCHFSSTPYLCQWQRCLKINQSGISAGDSFSPQIVRFCPVQPVSGQCRNI
ncbi:Uncharacterised protein [Shigella sonnei]|uniref:Uncharacterized protein n=4 Tax=Enterobacteriaceae TaxID=543 RepID=A0A144A3Z1_ECOLX|nr:hypothetical protein BCR79_25260 [Escherichia coli]QIQ11276.1 Mobile element protein [Klebsiella pneumoniae]CAB5620024.1 Uncharacterised protein [Citrobacter youngae]CSO51209.1 Uncharacterised protein [Shigella sonnei]CAF2377171.1 hypothetical protein AI2818V1_5197 [Klebsiella pneumoniae]